MRNPKLHESLIGREFTFNKCLVAPSNETDFLEHDIDLTTNISPTITLKIPIISASMDTVCEKNAAIALALCGGLGAIHYNFGENLDDNIQKQLKEVQEVKRYESGFVENPITLAPTDPIDQVAAIRKEYGISTVPITANGKLAGIITKDDYSLSIHKGMLIRERMIPLDQLVKVTFEELEQSGKPLEKANEILLNSHKSSLPVVDSDGNLKYLVTRSDIEKQTAFPHATRDDNKRLRVLAAVETKHDRALPRMGALYPHVDGFLIDSAHGFFKYARDLIKIAKQKYPEKAIVAGNVAWPDAVEYLYEAGADCVRVGTGPGGGCKTWDAAGTGREQVSAIVDCAYKAHELAKKRPFYLNADGGIENSGDIHIAIAAGAHTVTLGELIAGTAEAPGEIEIQKEKRVKKYRGMASSEALKQGGSFRYNMESNIRVPEGGVKYVDYRGSILEWIPYLIQGVKQGMFKAGCKTVTESHDKAVLIYADKEGKRQRANFER